MKTFTQYYIEQRYWIWQALFLFFAIGVTWYAWESDLFGQIVGTTLSWCPSVLWVLRARSIYSRLVRLNHESVRL